MIRQYYFMSCMWYSFLFIGISTIPLHMQASHKQKVGYTVAALSGIYGTCLFKEGLSSMHDGVRWGFMQRNIGISFIMFGVLIAGSVKLMSKK